MAYTELTTALARTLFLFDLRKAPGMQIGEGSREMEYGRHRPFEYQTNHSFTSIKDGPMVQFKPR